MQLPSAATFPDDAELLRRLRRVLGSGDLRLISRAPVAHPGRGYAAEVLEVAFGGTSRAAAFAKHGAAVTSADPFRGGHIGGLAYEFRAQSSAHAVASRGVATPLGQAGGRDCSMSIFSTPIQGTRLADAKMRDRLAVAARWLGEFHRRWDIAGGPTAGLNSLDAPFFAQWLESAHTTISEYAPASDIPAPIRNCYREDVEVLLAAPHVLLHGDCYPTNALVDNSGLWLVDWELAALGPGEVDIATLTLGWPEESVTACMSAYAEARWPTCVPRETYRRFLAARRYVLLRILSVPPRPHRLRRYLGRLNTLLNVPRPSTGAGCPR